MGSRLEYGGTACTEMGTDAEPFPLEKGCRGGTAELGSGETGKA